MHINEKRKSTKKRLGILLVMGMLLVTSSITVYGATEENEAQQPKAATLYCTGEVAKTVYGKNTIQIHCYTELKNGMTFNPRYSYHVCWTKNIASGLAISNCTYSGVEVRNNVESQ